MIIDITRYIPTAYKEYQSVLSDNTYYKYMCLFYSTSNYLGITTYEGVNNTITNNYISPQQIIYIDTINGGTLNIFCTSSYFCITGKTLYPKLLDASNQTVILLSEFSRDDLWNVSPYVPVALLLDKWYSPRLKTNISTDSTGTNSYLIDCPEIWDNLETKQLIDEKGIVYNAQTDVRLINDQYPRLVLGGKLLGGIKRTANNFGSMYDEVTINNITYINISMLTKILLG
jgi:hypothetical protein